MQFTVEIEALTETSVTARVTKSAPEVRMGSSMIRGMVASALCASVEGMDYAQAFRLTDTKTEWMPQTKTYAVWDWSKVRVDDMTIVVTIQFPDESKQLFKKQPDGSYAASMSDLLGR